MLKIITLVSFLAMAINSEMAKQSHSFSTANFQFLLALVFIVSFCLLARREYKEFVYA